MDIIRTGIPHRRTPPAKGKCSYLAMGKKGGEGEEKGAQIWILNYFENF